MNRKGNSPLVNGIILAAVFGYLCYYFTANSMWNAATVIVMLIIAAMAVGQVLLYIFFFRDKKSKK